MFDGPGYPFSLSEQLFEQWLEEGRKSMIGYNYLVILWDSYDSEYLPAYVSEREQIHSYERYESATGRESMVAAYDLYSESRIV